MNLSQLVAFVVGLSLGIFLSIFANSEISLNLLFFVPVLVVIPFLFKKSTRLPIAYLNIILIGSVFFGYFYTNFRTIKPNPILQSQVGKSVYLKGTIVSNPNVNAKQTNFILKTEQGKLRATFFIDTPVSFGDMVLIKGTIKEPENFETETGKIFDYKNYLAKDGIFFIFSGNSIQVTEHPTFSFKRSLFSVFNNANRIIDHSVHFPENSLTKGVLLGDDSSMPKEMKSAYVQTGTIHIVALSGYNISILLTWVLYIARRFLTYRWGTILGLVCVVLFVLGTGGSQTAIRAGIMGSLALIANYYGRSQLAVRLLLMTYAIMLLLNPFILPYDVSFHLSFLATFGIIGFQKKFENYFKFLPRLIRELLGTTLSAQLLVLPYLVSVFGQLSVISIPVNVIIGPLVPILMFAGLGVTILGAMFSPFGIFAGFLTTKIAWLLTAIVNFFSKLPLAYITVTSISIWLLVGYYLFVLVWYSNLQKRENV